MNCTTWAYEKVEGGKIVPVKINRVIDENIIRAMEDKINGAELSR